MSTLILSLPLAAASPSSLYTFTEEHAHASVRQASAALLPRTGRSTAVVAVVPAEALSWHAVELPAGKPLRGATLRAALVGLLEDRLLDDPQQLHLALQPHGQAGQRVWVAVCHKAWLQGHVQALEAANISVTRIVPALSPASPEAEPQWLVTGTPTSGWLWISAAQGVWGLPFPSGLEALRESLPPGALLLAEPAVAEWAQHHLRRQPTLIQPAQRLLTAAQSAWDLAQFDLAATGSARGFKALGRLQQTLWQSAAWRPARWGLGVLVASQLLGLNAWAWKLQSDLRQRQAGMAQVMTQTFPDIQVVVDAPLQMSREVQRLRQAAGQSANDGLEPLLAALGQALPAGQTMSALDYQTGQLRVKGLNLTEAQATSLPTQLQAHRYAAQREASVWMITTAKATP